MENVKLLASEVAKAYNKAPENSKVYVGSDSVRYTKEGQAFARITVVAVLHLAGRHGCKVFHTNIRERVYDKNLGRPQHRMMMEAYHVAGLFLEIQELVPELEMEIHLDINPNKEHGSSCAAQQAAGYVMGMCGVQPLLKPKAWAASTCADLVPKKLK